MDNISSWGKLLYSTGSSTCGSVMIQRGRLGWAGREGRGVSILTADSCCTVGTNTL